MATFTVDAAGGHEYELIGAELVKMRATSRGGVTLHNYVFEVESTGSALEGDWRELQFLAHKPAVGGQTDAQGKRRRETELCPSEPQAQRPRGTSETFEDWMARLSAAYAVAKAVRAKAEQTAAFPSYSTARPTCPDAELPTGRADRHVVLVLRFQQVLMLEQMRGAGRSGSTSLVSPAHSPSPSCHAQRVRH